MLAGQSDESRRLQHLEDALAKALAMLDRLGEQIQQLEEWVRAAAAR